jgi:SAM-dependent methyltransferase
LDAPGIVRGLGVASLLFPLGIVLVRWGRGPLQGLAITAIITGAFCGIEVLWMVYSSRIGKLAARDRLLDALRLRGDEQLLDVGCGHGLLLIGAAKRLETGRSFGIDLWSQVDQGRNSREATLANAALEGVAERVEVRDGDMRALPFPEGMFDAVVASFAIHNVSDRQGRRKTIREIVRVTKPGGQVALQDFQRTAEYALDLEEAAMEGVGVSRRNFWVFPPARTVVARKPLRPT